LARSLRITYPGAFYHATSRGNDRKDIFKNQRDRENLLEYFESATKRYEGKYEGHIDCPHFASLNDLK
jgi:putative transposase